MGFTKHADVPLKDVKVLTPEEAAAQVKQAAQKYAAVLAAQNNSAKR